MKYFSNILLLFLSSLGLFSQEYEIAWEKDIGGSYAQFSKDGEFIYVAKGNTISKYRSSDGSFVSTFDNSGVPNIYGMNISSSGNYIATRDGGGGSNIWDVKAEKAIKQYTDMIYTDILNDSICITIKVIGGEKRKISLNNYFTGKEIKSVNTNYWHGNIKLSHNGKMFATASFSLDGTKYYLTLWDTETLTEIKRFELNSSSGTIFIEIKFSWDDNFVGVRTFLPYITSIFNTTTLEKRISSYEVINSDSYGFDFTINGKYCFYYINSNFYIYENDLKTINSFFNIKGSPLTTSSNNLIFTRNALLRPKTVGVQENQQNRLSISPNPASDYIEINVGVRLALPLLESFEIYNIFGEKNPTLALPVREGTGKVLPNGEDLGGVFKIDVSNLSAGVYFIKIGDKFEKFVKM